MHLKTPLLFSGVGIESNYGAATERFCVGVDGTLAGARGIIGAGNGAGVCATGIAQALSVVHIYAREDRRVVFPSGEIK